MDHSSCHSQPHNFVAMPLNLFYAALKTTCGTLSLPWEPKWSYGAKNGIKAIHLKSTHPHAFHICTTMHKILKTILFHHTWTTVRMSIPLLPRQSPPLQCYQGQVYANGQGNLHHYNNIRVHFTTLEAWPCLSAYSLPSRVSYNSWHRAGLTVLRYSPCEYATCPGF